MSVRALTDRHGVHRRTVRQALDSPVPAPRKPAPLRGSRLDPYKSTIDDLLRADQGKRPQHRRTTKDIHQMLVTQHGATGISYSTVRDYVAGRCPFLAPRAGDIPDDPAGQQAGTGLTWRSMAKRISLGGRASEPNQQLHQLHTLVEKTAADAGLDQRLILLIYIRSSMLNGCAFCLDMHTRDARKLGETERRIYLLSTWQETDLYSEQERAALALTDAMTRLSETRDVPDEIYEQAVSVFTEDQYRVVAWAVTVINAFNRLGVTSRWKLPPEPH